MKALVRIGLVLLCAVLLAASLYGLASSAGPRPGAAAIWLKVTSSPEAAVFPSLLLIECYLFANDFLVWLASRFRPGFGLGLSEFRFNEEMSNDNRPIPLRAKLWLVYPWLMAVLLLGTLVSLNG